VVGKLDAKELPAFVDVEAEVNVDEENAEEAVEAPVPQPQLARGDVTTAVWNVPCHDPDPVDRRPVASRRRQQICVNKHAVGTDPHLPVALIKLFFPDVDAEVNGSEMKRCTLSPAATFKSCLPPSNNVLIAVASKCGCPDAG
jgi:hypothetical protein